MKRFTQIWTLMRGQRLRYLTAIVALIVASCFLYAVPLVPQATLDGVLDESAEPSALVRFVVACLGGREFVAANLWWPGLVVLLLTIAAGLFTYLRGRWSAHATEQIVRSIRDRAYDHLQRLPCRYFDRVETGDLVQRCTSDVETLRLFLSTQVVEIGRAIVMLLIPIPLMLAIDVRMTIASLVLIPFLLIFAAMCFESIRTGFKSKDEAEGRLTTAIQENLTGVRVVRAFARQDHEREKFDPVNSEHRVLDFKLYKLFGAYWSISTGLCLLQRTIVVGCGAYWLALGTLQVGAFYFFLSAAMLFIWPMQRLGRILADLGKAVVAVDRLLEILAEPLETVSDEAPVRLDSVAMKIEFDAVSFEHAAESPVLQDVSFSIEPGETLAILGPSGCGKSTVINLLLRLYDYDTGSIRVDGHELRSIGRENIRSRSAVVMQEPFLYSRTLRENIRMGRPCACEEEIIEATTIACVHDAILEFEDGYETLVGERGVTLSGGQRQRVAIARALLQRPALLVLDDALSAVDTETESIILEALGRVHGRQTTIVIAHRLSTLRHADRILVLDEGRVVQLGSHAELVDQEGLYRRLWALQTSQAPLSDHSTSLSQASS